MLKENAGSEPGSRLRSIRAEMGQRAFARRLGLRQQTISNYEQGKLPGCWRFLRRLKEEFHVDLNWLILGPDQPHHAAVPAGSVEGAELQMDAPTTAGDGDGAPEWRRAVPEQLVFEETDTLDLLLHFYFLYLATETPESRVRLMVGFRRIVAAARMSPELKNAPADETELLSAVYEALEKDDRRAVVAALLRLAEWLEHVPHDNGLQRVRKLYLAAMSLARSNRWRTDELRSAQGIGRSYRKEGRWPEAELFLSLAIATFEEEPQEARETA